MGFQGTCSSRGRARMPRSLPTMNTKAAWAWQQTLACCSLMPSWLISGRSPAWWWLGQISQSTRSAWWFLVSTSWREAQEKRTTTPPLLTFLSSSAETPTELKISDKAEELEIGKLTKVGVFNAKCCSYLRNFRHFKHQGKTPGSRGIIETTLLL